MSNIPLKYYLKKEIAAMYGITVKVLRREINDAEIFPEGYYAAKKLLSPKDFKKIIEALGEPTT